jgi:hypothetical protein
MSFKLPFLSLPLLLLAGAVQAQATDPCPQLPEGSGLAWDHKGGKDFDFCSAERADGSQAFGVTLSPEAPFEPSGSNRAEAGTIAGQATYWYRSQVATQPGVETREALVQLGDGRVAHVFVQAADAAQLAREMALVQALRFDSNRISGR